MNPGARTNPPASSVVAAGSSTVPTATILPSRTPTSPWRAGAPVPSTIVAPVISSSSIGPPAGLATEGSSDYGPAPSILPTAYRVGGRSQVIQRPEVSGRSRQAEGRQPEGVARGSQEAVVVGAGRHRRPRLDRRGDDQLGHRSRLVPHHEDRGAPSAVVGPGQDAGHPPGEPPVA